MPSPSARKFQEGLAAAYAGDTERALAIAKRMLARNPIDVHAHQIIGFSHFCRGDHRQSFEAFSKADRLAPNQPAIINWLGLILKERGDFEQAGAAFKRARRLAPNDPEIACNLGETLALLGDRQGAQSIYESAASTSPPDPQVLAKTARFFERGHQLEEARQYAEKALAIDPNNEIALIAMAEIENRQGDYEAAIARLAPVAAVQSSNNRNRANMCRQLAEAYHRTGRFDQAFGAYVAANNLQKGLYADSLSEPPSPWSPDIIARLIAFFEQHDPATWTRFDKRSDPAPIFLLGFVRSGTTWLDQILSSVPDVAVLEEEDNLSDAWSDFLLDANGLNRLASLSESDIEPYRQIYWRLLRSRVKDKKSARIFVDKVPLYTVLLGLIYRLFPDAKIIFALRDPRDCVLSAFQQHFAVNTAMSQFLSLETAAAYYDQVMTLAEICRRKFPLDLHVVRYENLVRDLEAEVRPLIEFLGLDWSDDALRYDETARKRNILTPSFRQVVNRPYSSSVGKWRHYEKHMRPVLPILNKWAAEYGY